jgi:carbohydrate diacid regulator
MVTDPRPASALTAELAQEIAGETSRIIGLNVLITDRDAVVIGSGDTARVGTVHEASAAVIRDLEPAWHTAAQARALSGVRPGMTLPIMLDGVAVGTVALTGSPRRVRQFGLVVQRQTEILLRQAILLRSRMLRDRALTDLFRDIALYDPDATDAEALAQRARELGLDPTLRRTVLLVDTGTAGDPAPGLVPADPLEPRAGPARSVREEFHSRQDVVAELTAGRIGVLCHVGGELGLDRVVDDTALRDRCARLVAELRRTHRVAGGGGGGGEGMRTPGIHNSYTDAATALRLAPLLTTGDTGVFPIAELRPHQLLADANPRARERFRAATLVRLRGEPDWPIVRETLIAWAESGFNLVRAANQLHIHRNSLLYRLDKIESRAGRSCRDPRNGLALYLAALTDQLGEHAPEP